jgi:hypothetical protein
MARREFEVGVTGNGTEILFDFLLLGTEEASSAMLQRYVRRTPHQAIQSRSIHSEAKSRPSIMLMHHFPNAILMLENAYHMISWTFRSI